MIQNDVLGLSTSSSQIEHVRYGPKWFTSWPEINLKQVKFFFCEF